jgi:energy-coupling factor transporter ATP-binding protein EcfA2
VVGLLVALALWRSGPLGTLGWMYTPQAMVIAQVLIALPLVVGITLAAVGALPADFHLQVRALGVRGPRAAWLLVRETRRGLLAAVIAGLGGILSEVGAVTMVGGNLEGETRVLTSGILMYPGDASVGAGAGRRAARTYLRARRRWRRCAGGPAMSGPIVVSARELVVERRSRASRFELRVPALALRAGEVLCVLGPNGAGKSTLLRALAGLERPLAGSIERGPGLVTMVFQRPIAFAGTVGHNLHAALYGSGLARAERDARTTRALARFGIAGLVSRRAAALSGGELRRLALARAFALEPAALLLDEPFDDLDARSRALRISPARSAKRMSRWRSSRTICARRCCSPIASPCSVAARSRSSMRATRCCDAPRTRRSPRWWACRTGCPAGCARATPRASPRSSWRLLRRCALPPPAPPARTCGWGSGPST